MLLIQFYIEKVEDRTASLAAGRLIYKDEDRCRIMIPGQREDIREHILDKERLDVWRASTDPQHRDFLKQYELWKEGREIPVEGTPLEVSTFLSPAQIENLKAPPFGIRTVEHLAQMSDAQLMGIPMGMGLRDQAKRFVEAATGPAAVAAQLSDQANVISTQQAQIAQLQEQIAGLLKGGGAPGQMVPAAPAVPTGIMPTDDDDDIGSPAPGAIPADPSKVKRRPAEDEDDDAGARYAAQGGRRVGARGRG